MDLSFVILTWNSERHINECIGSILAELSGQQLKFEIFIVDNGSKDGTVAALQQLQARFPQIVFPIFLDRNMGTTKPRNMALRRTRGKTVAIMDSDVEVLDGSLISLLESLRRESSAGIVAPRLVYADGSLQKSTDRFPTVLTKAIRFFFLKQMEREHQTDAIPAFVSDVDYAISAVWIIRRKAIDVVGLLDEKIFYAPEDVDYCLRMWKAGFKVLYDSGPVFVHHTQEISRGLNLNVAKFNHIAGLAYYFRKHGYYFRAPRYGRKRHK